jgi:magnesium transporter
MGLPPGTLFHVGDKKVEQATISVIDYDPQNLEIKDLKTVEEAFPFKESPTVTWLNISGLHDIEIMQKVGGHFGVHALVLEDIVNTSQRSKIEAFDDYIFIVLKMITYNKEKNETEMEQVSLILGKNFVITFQEREGDIFEPVRRRIHNVISRLRNHGPDYLAYALLDVIVDHYYVILEHFGDAIEFMEEEVLKNPRESLIPEIQRLKRETLILRKSLWPLREALADLKKAESALITDFTLPYLDDTYDHTMQVLDTLETFREMVTGIMDIYLSNISHRMNEVMKMLTIIATIFIPLTFIAGIYGMNFEHMPELHWSFGYPMVWSIMLVMVVLLLLFFRKKRWL